MGVQELIKKNEIVDQDSLVPMAQEQTKNDKSTNKEGNDSDDMNGL